MACCCGMVFSVAGGSGYTQTVAVGSRYVGVGTGVSVAARV